MNSTEIKACPICGEPRKHFAVTKWRDVNGAWCYTEACEWCGSSFLRETLDGKTGKSPRAGDRQPVTPEVEGVKALASATCSAATLKRAIAALDHEVSENEMRVIGADDELHKKIMESIKADQAAMDELEIIKQQNGQAQARASAITIISKGKANE